MLREASGNNIDWGLNWPQKSDKTFRPNGNDAAAAAAGQDYRSEWIDTNIAPVRGLSAFKGWDLDVPKPNDRSDVFPHSRLFY
ncbi:hypothetical protein PM082_004473 [Marasmius tenuissimus]|nr:hypothetical protein PM082_004473 [Marasmius tenuissimus]